MDLFMTYLKAIPIIQSRESLRELYVIETPNLKEHARSSRYQKLQEDAFPKEKNVLSFDQLAEQLK